MKNLILAMEQLEADLLENGYSPELVAGVAAEFGVRSELLHRKFLENYGRAPETYTMSNDAGVAAGELEPA